jgi:hypothetical protein
MNKVLPYQARPEIFLVFAPDPTIALDVAPQTPLFTVELLTNNFVIIVQ